MKTTIFNRHLVYIFSLQNGLDVKSNVNQRFSVYNLVYISVYTKTAVNKGFNAFVNYVNSKLYKTVLDNIYIKKAVKYAKNVHVFISTQSYAPARESLQLSLQTPKMV